MYRTLLNRPIAVTMTLIAIFTLGIISIQRIPVSLMPDIDIPRITVQIAADGTAAQEMEKRYVTPMRHQLSQVAGLKNIESVSRVDAGSITLEFETGSDMSLLFIEVNEKIDRAMNHMPKDMERPKVVKASAMDVPAFYLDIYFDEGKNHTDLAFAQLGKFVKSVVSKRIEQLPQTAMVDVSGSVGTEIECTPDRNKLKSLGLTVHDIEHAIQQNNITCEALSVRDGIFRYNIHFDSQLLTKDDVADIYLNHGGRLLQLKDLCTIKERVATRNGMVKHRSGRMEKPDDALTMAIIKQNDAQMEDLQESMDNLLDNLRAEYPGIRFELTRDQTRLLTYTIENLKSNLIVAALLACMVIFVFMRQWRLSLLIAFSVPLSLVITILTFYLCGITLNVVSLSGLILGVGMIVDNSIIVIDNIIQRWRKGTSLQDAVISGTKEVQTPMLSSVLTTCSVFVPLIFLSGIAGALFYDQAMGVTFALFASLLVASIVTPVYFFAIFRKRKNCLTEEKNNKNKLSHIMTVPYEKIMRWVLRHAGTVIMIFLCIIPLTAVLLDVIEKEKMPYISQEDTLMTIDWNQGISTEENNRRVEEIMKLAGNDVLTSTSMVGGQEFLLSHTPDITSSEAVVYMKCRSEETLGKTKRTIVGALQDKYPEASVEFGQPGNIYDLFFTTDNADLQIQLRDLNGRRPDIASARKFVDSLRTAFPSLDIMPVVAETNLKYVANPEQMALYHVTYESLHRRIKELMSRSRIFEISDGASPIPVIIGANTHEAEGIIASSVTNDEGTDIPISYLVKETKCEDYKTLQASGAGEYYGININGTNNEMQRVMDYTDTLTNRCDATLSASYAGGYFSSRQMIGELSVVLLVALALLYFILAAQFESLIQPLIILLEMVIDIFFVILGLWLFGESLNIMSMTGIVVMSGIIINDSILKVDTINRYRRNGHSLIRAIWTAGHKRLRPIVMTSLTTILALLPFLSKGSIGSALQYPLSLSLIIGMTAGTLVSVFFVPLLYYMIYRKRR